MKGTYHDGQNTFLGVVIAIMRELTQSFLDLQEVCGVDEHGVVLDLLFLCISTMISCTF